MTNEQLLTPIWQELGDGRQSGFYMEKQDDQVNQDKLFKKCLDAVTKK